MIGLYHFSSCILAPICIGCSDPTRLLLEPLTISLWLHQLPLLTISILLRSFLTALPLSYGPCSPPLVCGYCPIFIIPVMSYSGCLSLAIIIMYAAPSCFVTDLVPDARGVEV